MMTDYTHIAMLLDRSGSMAQILADTLGGVNTFIKAQKEAPGKCTVTMAQFDNVYEVIHEMVPIASVPELTDKTFVPRGMTALYDSACKLILDTGRVLAALPDDQRPAKVIFVIITDGQENESREFTKEMLASMVKHQTEAYQWSFVYLGANQDAMSVGSGIGISGAASMSYATTKGGMNNMYNSLNNAVLRSRCSMDSNVVFSDQEREEAMSK